MRQLFFLLVTAVLLPAEVRYMTLRQVADLAQKQSPEIALARLEEQQAAQAVRIARDPFSPRVAVGSGLAYSSGFPMSIEGATPSIVQARATQFLFNRQQSYAVAQAKEEAVGASISTGARRDEVAFRAASLFLDAERAGRVSAMLRKEAESLEKVAEAVRSRVEEGRELPLENRRAALNLARARQFLMTAEADQAAAETSLAIVLGFGSDDRIRPTIEERTPPPLPDSEETAVAGALESSKELRRLESRVAAKGLELRGERAARLPRIDLVAQYGLLARFNNYEDFFRKFQRHNGQIGLSFQLPLLTGPGVSAAAAQTQAEIAHLRIQMNQARDRVAQEARLAFRQVRISESARDVARLDLELAREQLSVILAQMQEGRASLRQVEEARITESTEWIEFYDAQHAVERARWNLLRHTGDLMAALR
jgi:outer membrane protein TolC